MTSINLVLLLTALFFHPHLAQENSTSPAPPDGSDAPSVPPAGSDAPPAPSDGTVAPPAPTDGSAAPPAPTDGSAAPPATTDGSAAPPATTDGSAVPPAPSGATNGTNDFPVVVLAKKCYQCTSFDGAEILKNFMADPNQTDIASADLKYHAKCMQPDATVPTCGPAPCMTLAWKNTEGQMQTVRNCIQTKNYTGGTIKCIPESNLKEGRIKCRCENEDLCNGYSFGGTTVDVPDTTPTTGPVDDPDQNGQQADESPAPAASGSSTSALVAVAFALFSMFLH
ncbi:unnamed protein product, partial [Mesorhabditis spiculigera]